MPEGSWVRLKEEITCISNENDICVAFGDTKDKSQHNPRKDLPTFLKTKLLTTMMSESQSTVGVTTNEKLQNTAGKILSDILLDGN